MVCGIQRDGELVALPVPLARVLGLGGVRTLSPVIFLWLVELSHVAHLVPAGLLGLRAGFLGWFNLG